MGRISRRKLTLSTRWESNDLNISSRQYSRRIIIVTCKERGIYWDLMKTLEAVVETIITIYKVIVILLLLMTC